MDFSVHPLKVQGALVMPWGIRLNSQNHNTKAVFPFPLLPFDDFRPKTESHLEPERAVNASSNLGWVLYCLKIELSVVSAMTDISIFFCTTTIENANGESDSLMIPISRRSWRRFLTPSTSLQYCRLLLVTFWAAQTVFYSQGLMKRWRWPTVLTSVILKRKWCVDKFLINLIKYAFTAARLLGHQTRKHSHRHQSFKIKCNSINQRHLFTLFFFFFVVGRPSVLQPLSSSSFIFVCRGVTAFCV